MGYRLPIATQETAPTHSTSDSSRHDHGHDHGSQVHHATIFAWTPKLLIALVGVLFVASYRFSQAGKGHKGVQG